MKFTIKHLARVTAYLVCSNGLNNTFQYTSLSVGVWNGNDGMRNLFKVGGKGFKLNCLMVVGYQYHHHLFGLEYRDRE